MSGINYKITLMGVGCMIVLVVGCSDMEPLQQDVSTLSSSVPSESPLLLTPVSVAGLVFQVPEVWIYEAPSSSMRVAQYRIPRMDGDNVDSEMAVFHFGGGGGSVQANMDRWMGQFTAVDGGPVSDDAQISERDGNGVRITLADVSGTYNRSQGPMMTEVESHPGYRMIAAVVEGQGGPWFFKLTGPQNTVGRSQESFSSLLDSLRLDL